MKLSSTPIFLALIVGSAAQFLPEVKGAPPAKGAAPAAKAKPMAPQCEKDTGGTCAYMGCHEWRNAACEHGKCVCASGKDVWGTKGHIMHLSYCVFEGRCDTEEDRRQQENQEQASAALAHLKIISKLEEVASHHIAAQSAAANESAIDQTAAQKDAASAQAFRNYSLKAQYWLDASKANLSKAAQEVFHATLCLKSAKEPKAAAECNKALTKAQQEKVHAEASVVQSTQDAAYADVQAARDHKRSLDYAMRSAFKRNFSTACESDTTGTCTVTSCYAWRNAECVVSGTILGSKIPAKKCLCRKGSCAFNGMCVPSIAGSPFEPKNRSAIAKAIFEKEIAADQTALAMNEKSACEKDTKHACNMGFCLYDGFTTKCVDGTCVCKEEGACVYQGTCVHRVTAADLGSNYSSIVKMTAEASVVQLGSVSLAALSMAVLFGVGVHLARRQQRHDFTEPLLADLE